MLENVREEGSLEDTRDHRAWITSAVLVARHLERVANNAGELGGRVRFVATGEHFARHARAAGGSHAE